MPFPPKPYTFVCDKCGWKKTLAPLSDALRPGEWFEQCPKCGNKELRMRAARWWEKALAEFMRRW